MNQIVRICREHQAGYALHYESEHEAYQLAEGVRDGNVHLGSEVRHLFHTTHQLEVEQDTHYDIF